METFSIVCETCQQRLTVRDKSAIGEIMICPKCGSMVMVELPEDAEKPEEAEKPEDVEKTVPSEPPTPTASEAPPVQADSTSIPAKAAKSTHRRPFNDADEELPDTKDDLESPYHTSPELAPRRADRPADVEQSSSDSATETLAEVVDPAVEDAVDQHIGGEDQRLANENLAEGELPDDRRPDDEFASDDDRLQSTSLPPSTDWTSRQTQQIRQWLLVAGAAVAGVILAVSTVGFLVSRGGQVAVNAGPDKETRDQAPDGESEATPDDSTQQHSKDSEPAENDATDRSNEEESTEEASNGKEPPQRESTETQDDSQTETDKPDTPPAKTVKEPTTDEDSPQDSPAKQPKASAPDGSEPLLLKPAEDTEQANAEDAAALAQTLEALAPFTDNTPFQDTNTKLANAAGKNSPTANGLQPNRPSVPRPPPRDIDAEARLNDPIVELAFTDVPLLDFLQFMSDYCTIPITVDHDALALVGVNAAARVNVQAKQATVAEVLKSALAPLRLDYVVAGDHLLVTRPPLPNNALRRLAHPVADLAGNDAAAIEELADMVTTFVRPDTWESAGGAGKLAVEPPQLVIEQDEIILFHTLVFLEKLRTARGLPPQTKFSPALFQLGYRPAKLEPKLQTKLTATYLQPASLVRILDRLQQETGVLFAVDWQSIADLDWTTEAATTLAVADEPLAVALDKLLGPMDLSYRMVDEMTVEVTSPQAVDTRLEVAVYALDSLLTADADSQHWIERIRRELGESLFDDSGGSGQITFDAASKCLIVALPQVPQLRVSELLASWRKNGPQKN